MNCIRTLIFLYRKSNEDFEFSSGVAWKYHVWHCLDVGGGCDWSSGVLGCYGVCWGLLGFNYTWETWFEHGFVWPRPLGEGVNTLLDDHISLYWFFCCVYFIYAFNDFIIFSFLYNFIVELRCYCVDMIQFGCCVSALFLVICSCVFNVGMYFAMSRGCLLRFSVFR